MKVKVDAYPWLLGAMIVGVALVAGGQARSAASGPLAQGCTGDHVHHCPLPPNIGIWPSLLP